MYEVNFLSECSFNPTEVMWLQAMKRHPLFKIHPSYTTDFNLLRWAYAYSGQIDLAIKKYRRHLKIREILQLDTIENLSGEDHIDESADYYAPLVILGNVSKDDHRIVLVEQSGRFDLHTMMKSIRTSTFMMNRFRLMERILNAIKIAEQRSGQLQSAVLLIDLQGLKFQSNLISFIAGPYRILWGTLVEQYPSLISQIIAINFPTGGLLNVLWSACSAFIPDDYKKKIHILGENWQEKVSSILPISALPKMYGGLQEDKPPPTPCRICPPILNVSETNLNCISIPAGGFLVQTFYFMGNENLEFYIKNEKEFTMNIFYTFSKKEIKNPTLDVDDDAEEVFAGCERPGLPTLDFWKWRIHRAGFYHAIFGNEKAWIRPVNVKYQIFQIHQNGSKIKVNPISVSN